MLFYEYKIVNICLQLYKKFGRPLYDDRLKDIRNTVDYVVILILKESHMIRILNFDVIFDSHQICEYILMDTSQRSN
jgi:hypothetical protein